MNLTTAELAFRLLVAGGLGALVGLDRELTDQPAGLRTHVLVSLGACLFTLTGAYGFEPFFDDVRVDPTRVAAQIVTGIGFLGAGAIIRQGFSIRGLTTAAGLWVTAAVGMAAGFGNYEGAVFTTLVAALALFGLKRVERSLLRGLKRGLVEYVIDAGGALDFSRVTAVIERHRGRVQTVRMDTGEGGERHLVVSALLPPRASAHELAGALEDIEGVAHVHWTG